jgi:hypothetical protein
VGVAVPLQVDDPVGVGGGVLLAVPVGVVLGVAVAV